MIAIKRSYDAPAKSDGRRFLVDGLWPRGVSKAALKIEAWVKDVAPSAKLRRWFGHDPAKWADFQRRYRAELDAHPDSWLPLLEAARNGDITLIFSARDTEHNNAVILKSCLDHALRKK